MSHQRQKYRLLNSGNKPLISNEMIVQLEHVKFQWMSDSKLIRKTTWNEQFSELLDFKKEWGHCNIPKKYDQCPKSGNWVRGQRRQYILLKSGKKSFINN